MKEKLQRSQNVDHIARDQPSASDRSIQPPSVTSNFVLLLATNQRVLTVWICSGKNLTWGIVEGILPAGASLRFPSKTIQHKIPCLF